MLPIHKNHPAYLSQNKVFDELPAKILQFGTGVLLRGLPDYFVHKANERGIFNGSIIAIKSTSGTIEGKKQDFLFTHLIRGIEKGELVDESYINSSIQKILSAQDEWHSVLATAKKPAIQIIISNTTEVGLQYTEESIFQNPPASFPAKLTAWLYERSQVAMQVNPIVVIPTELVSENGKKLQEIVFKLAHFNQLGKDFEKWLYENAIFCNSLVDRIVPGKPKNETELQKIYEKLGYIDEQLIISEPYRLWAIEGDEEVKRILSFAKADEGVIVTPDIEPYKERKLRLLNGTHTISVPLAFLRGKNTVYEAMQDYTMSYFFTKVALNEIVPTLDIASSESIKAFAEDVLDRFRNPFIEHRLLDITFQSTMKMRMRNVPTLLRYYQIFRKNPELMIQGFAAYLLFMRATESRDGKFYGERNGEKYLINDEAALYFYQLWKNVKLDEEVDILEFVENVLSNEKLWEHNLNSMEGLKEAISNELLQMLSSTRLVSKI
jgi:tagaturonate reductase